VILPTKGIPPEQALLAVGARILKLLDRPKTVSRVWDELRTSDRWTTPARFDWFMLALDLLYVLGAIEMTQGRLRRAPTVPEASS
jgi:hypothetical protein